MLRNYVSPLESAGGFNNILNTYTPYSKYVRLRYYIYVMYSYGNKLDLRIIAHHTLDVDHHASN